MEIGMMSFADMEPETSGKGVNGWQRMKNLLEEIQLADQLGLDVFGIGEHHRPDYAVSSPATVLAAAAMVTKHIKLTSAVTVLSSDDPVRVYQEFATVDLLSGGRAEIMAGRGSFIESFPLFGYSLDDYDSLFTEKLELLLKLNQTEKISWTGKHRPEIKELGVYPRAYQTRLPIWLAAGGTPASAVRAAKLGLPLMLAIIGGMPEQFAGFINLYKQTALQQGKQINDLQVGVNNHVFIAEDSQKAADSFFPYYAAMMNRVGRDRGWPPLTRPQFDAARSPRGALMVGSVEQVVEKILFEYELFGNTRFLAQASLGFVPHAMTMRSIELFGTKVVPAVRKELGVKS
ncbi:MAG: LLM class flavin-dependent oxidoreductase [Chitinophagaceae bacterium]|nr:MAG: LLM class flavin-dependent oxidoreductase [Chitinophagaceae bacterium]